MKTRYGIFIFALAAFCVLLAGTPMHSAVAQLNSPDHSMLRFTSQPPLFARVGVPFLYRAKAFAPDTTIPVRYFGAFINPPGFTIDSASGVVNWVPTLKGWFEIVIRATAVVGGQRVYGEQRFTVGVTAGNGIVQGKVTDTLGAGIPHIIVELFQAISGISSNDGQRLHFAYAAQTDSLGNYRIAGVDPGFYKLRAVSPGPRFMNQWYDGKSNPAEANTIRVDNSSVTIANFILRGGPAILPRVTVSGSVTDTLFQPLQNAHIFFVRAGFALNIHGVLDDFRRSFDMNQFRGDNGLRGNSPHVFHAAADNAGNYSLRLPAGVYIAFAKAPEHLMEFYQEESNFLAADRIEVTANLAGINFTLAKLPPVALGTIEGSVSDSSKGIGIPSRVIVMRDRWRVPPVAPWAPRTYVVDTDSLGFFSADSLLPGQYLVMALPLGNYAPAFYTADTVNFNWRRGARITVNGNVVTGINIYVRELPPSTMGYGFITGNVNHPVEQGGSLAGTMVFALRDGRVAGHSFTNASGSYSIAGLAPGRYAVMADKAGFNESTSSTVSVEYSTAGSPLPTLVNLSISTVTAIGSEGGTTPKEFTLGQNYPNPFNPTTTIEFTLPVAGRTSLRVYNLVGQEVATLMEGIQDAGSYQVTFQATLLPSGIYFYKLEGASGMQTRKMILMK